MKKMSLAAGVAALAISASLFAGCGTTKTTTNPANTANTSDSASAAQSVTEAPAVTETPAATEASATTDASGTDAEKAAPAATEAPVATDASGTDTGKAAPAAQNTAGQITAEEAQKAALADAGLQESDVVYKQTVLDTDDAVVKYEVDFYANDIEYEYDIDATTGAVLKSESDMMDPDDFAEMEALVKGVVDEVKATAENLTEDMALEIALKDAGATKNDVASYTVEKDYDDDKGVSIYEVAFHVGDKKYSYEIDLFTGVIYESEVESDN